MTRRRWTDADDDVLVTLVRQTDPPLSWPDIGARFAVSDDTAFNRYKTIARLRALPAKRGVATRWSGDEDAELLRRCDAGAPFEHLARDLGRSRAACKQRYNILKRPAAPPTVIAAVRIDAAREAAATAAERLRRHPPSHDSITAWLCGDPLPGRSALDEKAQGATVPRRQVTLPGRTA